MRASERKTRGRVIKRSRCPVRCAMARLASLRESGRSMRRIRGAVEIGQVAADAGRVGRRQIVIAVHVALGALQRGVGAGQRESGGRVVEGRIAPGRGGVALLAGLREIRLHVIGVGRALEISQMAAHACRVRRRQVVIAIHVALRALQCRMGACQGKSGGGVIKGRARPRGRGVALLTGLRESGSDVIRIRGALEIFQVAADAGGVGAGQIVVIVHVALGALHGSMGAGQGESGGGVIKGRAGPGGRAVALLAGLREPGSHVIGVRGALEIFQVAAHACRVRGRQVVVVVDVALRALHGRVRPGQGEPGSGVIESRACPGGGAVALLASLREAGRNVIGIRSALEIFQVAAHACRVGAGQIVVPIHMALRALQRGMRPRQRESGGGMIEIRTHPRRGVVTLGASLGEAGLHVIWSGRALEILQVAADTRRIRTGQVVIVIHMALGALHCGMGAGQREAGGGVIKRRARPGGRAVALLASLRESGRNVVRIRRSLEILEMTTDAGGVRAGQIVVAIHVALGALHAGVCASQREAGGRMVKIGTHPRRCVVTLGASLGKAGLHVIWGRGALEVLQVATDAGGVGAGQIVVPVHVALGALHRGMGSG